MKFAMIGAGAMGLRYGILLQEAGNDVTFIDTWQPHIDKIREQGGVYVMRDHKDRHLTKIKLETPETFDGHPDMFIFFTKQMQLQDYLDRCSHFFHEDQYAFTAMNGMGHIEKLQKYFADDKIIGGTALIATVLPGPGEVDFMGKRGAGKMNMCPLNEKPDAMCQALFDELQKAKMNPTLTDDFTGTLMTKVIFNSVINTICTMFELPMGEFGNFKGAYQMGRQLIDEAYDIIVLLCRWLETALAIGGDDELVTMNASAVTTQTYIRRVAQAIPSVEGIACIYQYVLNTQALFEIVVGKFCHIRVSNFHSPTGFLQFSDSAHYQNLRT